VDLEKAFDRVPREVIRWAMQNLGMEAWLVFAVMSMYTGAKTIVRTVYGNSTCFEEKVGMHQISALRPLLFVIAMIVILYFIFLSIIIHFNCLLYSTNIGEYTCSYLENSELPYQWELCCMLMTCL